MWFWSKQPLVGEGALRDYPKQRLLRRLTTVIPLSKRPQLLYSETINVILHGKTERKVKARKPHVRTVLTRHAYHAIKQIKTIDFQKRACGLCLHLTNTVELCFVTRQIDTVIVNTADSLTP